MFRFSVAGVAVDVVDMDGALARCEGFLSGGPPRQVITANPLMILAARKDPGLRNAFDAADLVVPDGAGIVLAARLRGIRLRRVPGIELMDRLCALAAARGLRVFFFGAAPGVAEAAARDLVQRHPGLTIVGTHHGYDLEASESSVISLISQCRPDLLFVALPTPLQDGWIHRHLEEFGVKLAMGVGGSFDVFSGRLRRAPRWMRSMGLEWLFRCLQEPSRLLILLRGL